MFFVVVEVLYYKIDDKSVSFIVVKPCDEVYLVCVANLTLLLLQVATTIDPHTVGGGGADRWVPNANNAAPAANGAPPPGPIPLPPLTDTERDLLRHHQGCFKCRRFHVHHRTANCPNGFPPGAGYQLLTEAMANAARPRGVNAVAAVDVGGELAQPEGVATAVAAVMPAITTVLGDGTESDEECVAPFHTPHLLWDCLLDGPRVSTHEKTRALIDSGSHTVLIDSRLVNRLALHRRMLPTPLEISLAMGGGEGRLVMREWVKIAPSTVSSSWKSHPVRAIIAENLICPVILGRPFLKINQFIVDHAIPSCVSKTDGIDLLNEIKTTTNESSETRLTKEAPKQKQTRSTPADSEQQTQLLKELKQRTKGTKRQLDRGADEQRLRTVLAAIRTQVELLVNAEQLQRLNDEMRKRFADRFPVELHPVEDLPTNIYHRFKLHDSNKLISRRQYSCPRKYIEAWHTLLQQHLDAGRIRPSSSQYASLAFIIPKTDPSVLPRWVNNYRELNANTVPDNHPLPRVDDILADCAKGRIWAKINMTNMFFQTRVHPDDINLMAVTMPFGLYEWVVMPMGCRNAPATHQRRMCTALRPYIGNICHIYLDDIIIWSTTVAEHLKNVEIILKALREHKLYCSPKKTELFCTSLQFLGHIISTRGIEADPSKVEAVAKWPVPRMATAVHSFLRLVRYMSAFLPKLAEYTAVLTPLTTKEVDRAFPEWGEEQQEAFEKIKEVVLSRKCLTVIDHEDPGE